MSRFSYTLHSFKKYTTMYTLPDVLRAFLECQYYSDVLGAFLQFQYYPDVLRAFLEFQYNPDLLGELPNHKSCLFKDLRFSPKN
jgi:hypothetical protein